MSSNRPALLIVNNDRKELALLYKVFANADYEVILASGYEDALVN